jgi:hypothetical protein
VRFPAAIFGKGWKLTTPFDGPDTGNWADEVKQPRLATYTSSACRVASDGKSVLFRVYHGAATTSGSKNPRSELREMRLDGLDEIEWDGRRGRHGLSVELSINKLTNVKPHTVVGQIHNGSDDVATIRAEGVRGTDRIKLYGTRGNDSQYAYMGEVKRTQRFKAGFDVQNGRIAFVLNGVRSAKTVAATAGSFFKTAVYLQSNPESAPGESTKAYTEVRMFSKPIVSHT